MTIFLRSRIVFNEVVKSSWLLPVFVSLYAGTVQAQLIDVDFNTNSLAATGGGPAVGPTMSGAAVLGAAGDQWNGIDISSGNGIPLIYANGSNSPVTMTFTSGGGYDVNSYGGSTPFAGTPYDALMEDYLYTGTQRTIALSGLATNSIYNLVLYNAANTAAAGRTTYFTVNGNIQSSTWNGSSSNLIAGIDYVEFTSAISDASGTLAITWSGNGSAEGDINGFQIQFVSRQVGPNFGPNVFLFSPSTPTATIQSDLDTLFAQQNNVDTSQFDANRYAVLFEPGTYNVSVNMGYYMQVLGLGQSPDAVTINGALQCFNFGGESTQNFWMSAENLAVIPTNSSATMTWSVSQGTSLRRIHVKGSLNVSDGTYCSGGFLADSEVDSTVNSISQQQWLSRNDIWAGWSGQVWNMVFVGVSNPPSGTWPDSKYTVITNTPLVREKPYLYVDTNANFFVFVPNLNTNINGTSWAKGPTPGVSVPISKFYLAQPGTDNAGTINAALNSGLNLILTPGIYHLTNSILVTKPDTIVMGLGFPTLVPTNGNSDMVISDVDGVKVSDILFDAGTTASPALLEVGPPGSSLNHSADPICLYDLHSRVGGQFAGTTTTCFTINANNVIGDNMWLWRADHGTGVGWTQNASSNGLIVNGNNVTIYGLFVEHHEQYQTLWNGNWGRVYFYQSELPYDAPSQSAWTHNGVNGYASYKVASNVTSHQAYGLGIYGVFQTSNVQCFDTIETPANSQQVNAHDMINVLIEAQSGSEMTHIINGTGTALTSAVTTATANELWLNPAFSLAAGLDNTGTNIAISLPTESWHTYQLQYKNALTAPSWLNSGSSFGGDDALETITEPTLPASRFYRIVAH